MADPEEEETESIYEEESDEENEEENEVEEEEDDVEEEIKPIKKRRCQRRQKVKVNQQICFDDEGDEEEEEDLRVQIEDEEEEEEEEEDEEEEIKPDALSLSLSVLSAISFVWENEVHEFEELCDPGNIETIYRKIRRKSELPTVIDEFGEFRYLSICEALMITPMVSILRALSTNEIDLSYRNVNTHSIRAVCAALEINFNVEKLILKYNKLKLDDCFYIGTILHYNDTISHLDFTGCRVGPSGLEKLIVYLAKNGTVVYLNLSKCNILDEGMKFLAYVLTRNNSIQTLDLSYNKLGGEAAEALGTAFNFNTSVTDLNLRYNNLFDPMSMKGFFRALATNDSLSRLDLSWNGLSGEDMGGYVGVFLKKNQTIKHLDLSDNRFAGLAIVSIKKGLSQSKSLETLKLGKNPMSTGDLEVLLAGTKKCSSLVQLDLEDLWVDKTFVKALKKIQQDREIDVKFAGIYSNYQVLGPDYPKVILQRAQFEAMKPKNPKKRKDFGHLIWSLGDEPLTQKEFMEKVMKFKAKISQELFPELMQQFLIPKVQLVDVVAMKQKYLSIFPDSTPPPPPKFKGKKGQPEPETPPPELKDEEKDHEHFIEATKDDNWEGNLEGSLELDEEEEEEDELVPEETEENEDVNLEAENDEQDEEGDDEEKRSVIEET